MHNYKNADHPRVLIVAMSGIGNLLMQTPLIGRLKEENPTAEISVIVAPRGTKDVLKTNAKIKNIYQGNPKPSFKQWIGMVQNIQKEKFDVGIVTYPGQLVTSSSILYFGNVRQRIGNFYNYYFLKKSGLFLSDALPEKPIHDVEQNLNLLSPLGIENNNRLYAYDFPLSIEDFSMAENFLTESKITGEKYIGIHPGTNKDMIYKRWPTEQWIKLADQLADVYKAKILIFGGPEENFLKSAIKKNMRHKAYGVSLPLRATAALISKCAFFVSNDSGLMHISVSQKVQTFGLFGPTDERRTAPWGPFGHVIRAEGTSPNYDVTKLRQIKNQPTADSSMLALNEKFVLNKIEASLSEH
jgi:ADP-heptose:LPS heptosyltransferase